MWANTRDLFAAALAAGDETTQAEFLDAFVKELNGFCRAAQRDRPVSAGGMSMQIHYVAGRINQHTAEFFRELAATWDYLKERERGAKLQLRDLEDQINQREKRLRELEAESA